MLICNLAKKEKKTIVFGIDIGFRINTDQDCSLSS